MSELVIDTVGGIQFRSGVAQGGRTGTLEAWLYELTTNTSHTRHLPSSYTISDDCELSLGLVDLWVVTVPDLSLPC